MGGGWRGRKWVEPPGEAGVMSLGEGKGREGTLGVCEGFQREKQPLFFSCVDTYFILLLQSSQF